MKNLFRHYLFNSPELVVSGSEILDSRVVKGIKNQQLPEKRILKSTTHLSFFRYGAITTVNGIIYPIH